MQKELAVEYHMNDRKIDETIGRLTSIVASTMEALIILSPEHAKQVSDQLADQLTDEDIEVMEAKTDAFRQKLLDAYVGD